MTSTHRDLLAWQRAMDLCEQVYRASAGLPDDERFGLRDQLRRAAVAIPSNIAEGHGRGSHAEFRHFLLIARGSLREVETQLELACRLKMMDAPLMASVEAQAEAVGRVLAGLSVSLGTSGPAATESALRNPTSHSNPEMKGVQS